MIDFLIVFQVRFESLLRNQKFIKSWKCPLMHGTLVTPSGNKANHARGSSLAEGWRSCRALKKIYHDRINALIILHAATLLVQNYYAPFRVKKIGERIYMSDSHQTKNAPMRLHAWG